MRLYEAMRQAEPDVFIHAGDTIYADAPLRPEVKLDDGRVWRNVVTPEKSKVAETLDEFRGNHRYNLLDENVRRFNASLSQFVIWDDHEVLQQLVSDGDPGAPTTRATREHSVALLAARAQQAFFRNTRRCAFDADDPERIYRACRFGRWSTSSASTCAAIAAPTRRTARRRSTDDSAILGAAQVAWLKSGC